MQQYLHRKKVTNVVISLKKIKEPLGITDRVKYCRTCKWDWPWIWCHTWNNGHCKIIRKCPLLDVYERNYVCMHMKERCVLNGHRVSINLLFDFLAERWKLWDTGTQTEEHMHEDMTNSVVLQHWIKLFLLQWEQTG
jgi:hypothetical protein